VKDKLKEEQSEAQEALDPLEAEISKIKQKTLLVKKQTKEMLKHGTGHAETGLEKLSDLTKGHDKELSDFSAKSSVEVAAAAFGEEELNLPLITGLAFVNVLTAGFAYSYYRSTKQMRSFHSSLLEF